MSYRPLPDVSRLRSWLDYDPETGEFHWKRHDIFRCPGMRAGSQTTSGQRGIYFEGWTYGAHRLAWLWMTGEDPRDFMVDHIDGDPSNNRWSNLRLATHEQNMLNKKSRSVSGVKNVGWCRRTLKWVVSFKSKRFGSFECLDAAEAEARRLRTELHGAFANHRVDDARRREAVLMAERERYFRDSCRV